MNKQELLRHDREDSALWLKYKRLWWFYFEATKSRFVPRTGRTHHLVNDDFNTEQMLHKPEDVAEHQNTTSILFWAAIVTTFPELFDPERAFFTMFLAAIHDLPEGMTGKDCADNGLPEHDAGKEEEKMQMNSALSLLPEYAGNTLYEYYLDFENPTQSRDEMIVALKMVDKLDAILGLLADEKRGISGSISPLSLTASARDLKRAEYLGTSAVPDNWMFGLRKLLAQTHLRTEVANVILGIAWVAFMDVRNTTERKTALDGDVPYCLTADLSAVD
ncbi:HD domain-containing protein [Candidatus Saccharibacteria bacterium]|nr:HD domain-containing protein [Candidatus Saccharibacteria bacterium]